MLKYKYIFSLFLTAISIFSQETIVFDSPDSLYREDQFYVGVSYNILQNRPVGVKQNSFSTGLHVGFLRDFPINKKRTFAIAPGLGLSFQNFKYNLIVEEVNNQTNYSTLKAGVPFDKNKLALYFVDLPIEFRWRNSTPESHVFWRIYTGVKFSYLVLDRAKYIGDNKDITVVGNKDLNKFNYGVYIAAGRNTWNIYGYYGIQDIFKTGKLNGNPIGLNTLNLGLMFYIL